MLYFVRHRDFFVCQPDPVSHGWRQKWRQKLNKKETNAHSSPIRASFSSISSCLGRPRKARKGDGIQLIGR